MSVRILEGDCREVLRDLPDSSVHAVVTSPPYYSQRDYGVPGQLGMEETPEEYVAALVEVFREVRRVLRPDGSVFLNVGDTYASNRGARNLVFGNPEFNETRPSREKTRLPGSRVPNGCKPKDLIGVPWMAAFALRADGWYLRSPIIWYKPNCKPESASDRPGTDHEYVFLLSRSESYFYDRLAVRQGTHYLRTVWTINVSQYPGAHFATFPLELATTCIKAATPEGGCCGRCGAPFEPVVGKGEPDRDHQRRCGGDARGEYSGQATKDYAAALAEDPSALKARILAGLVERHVVDWRPSCDCWPLCVGCQTCEFSGGHTFAPLEPVPAVVLDPFAGTGTVGEAATKLGRDAILIELNPEFAAMARKRNAQGGLL